MGRAPYSLFLLVLVYSLGVNEISQAVAATDDRFDVRTAGLNRR